MIESFSSNIRNKASVFVLQGSSLGRIQGVPSRMNGVGESEKTHETSLDRAKSARERESERERESDQMGVAAESGRIWQCFIFYRGFYTLS